MESILFIHQGTGIGGASLCLKELLDEIKSDYEITVLCIFQSEAVDYFRKSGYRTEVLNSYFYRKIYMYFYHSEASFYTFLTPLAFIRAIISYILNLYFAKKVIAKFKPSLVHLNSSVLTDWAIVAKKSGAKVVIHVREPLAKGYFGIRKNILKYVINKFTDRIIAISKDNAKRVNIENKTTIIYDPIRTIKYENEINIDPDFKYFIYFGGTQALKGFFVLAESLKYLDNNIKIFIGGQFFKSENNKLISKIKFILKSFIPSYRKQLKLIEITEKSDKVIIIGVVNNIFDYISNSIALLFPSTKPHFADPVLEAYKIGKPVIVSDVDGMSEIVNKDTGLLFKNNNPQSLALSINKMSKITNNTVEEYKTNCLGKFEQINEHNEHNRINSVFQSLLK